MKRIGVALAWVVTFTLCAQAALAQIHGSIVVEAMQQTPGGAPLSGDEVVVKIFYPSSNHPAQQYTSRLDAGGHARFDDVTYPQVCQPLVSVRHAGGEFTAVGAPMNARVTGQTIKIGIFDTTETPNPWSVSARDVFIGRYGDALEVSERFVVQSSGDKAWTGQLASDGLRYTLDMPIPPDAADISVNNDLVQDLRLTKGRLRNPGPLLPGDTTFELRYTLPIHGAKASFDLDAPADTKMIMLIVPDDGTTLAGPGITGGEPTVDGAQRVRMYQVFNVKGGQTVTLSLSNLPDYDEGTVLAPSSGWLSVGSIFGAICGLALLVGSIIIFLRPAAGLAKEPH